MSAALGACACVHVWPRVCYSLRLACVCVCYVCAAVDARKKSVASMVEVEALCRGGVASTLAAVAANQRDVEASVRGLLGDAESLQSVIAHFAGDLRALVSTSAVRAWLPPPAAAPRG